MRRSRAALSACFVLVPLAAGLVGCGASGTMDHAARSPGAVARSKDYPAAEYPQQQAYPQAPQPGGAPTYQVSPSAVPAPPMAGIPGIPGMPAAVAQSLSYHLSATPTRASRACSAPSPGKPRSRFRIGSS